MSEQDRNRIFEEICERIASGESLTAICKEETMTSKRTFFGWVHKNEDKRNLYARARESWSEAHLEEIIEIADEIHSDALSLNAARLMIDARKWVLSKCNSKRFGDKLDVTSLGQSVPLAGISEYIASKGK